MSRNPRPANDSREWLDRAKSNLAHAGDSSPDVCLEDRCYDAEQAAEKAIKAIFINRGEPFPFIHDLEELLKRLMKSGVKVPKAILDADKLTEYAVLTRYPGFTAPVKPREYRRAVRIATAVLAWAERQILGPKKALKRKK
jgi:HEPN domain-containing protein